MRTQKESLVQVFTTSDVGAIVRARRRELGLTQIALAERVGVGITYVSNLENGKETAELGKALHILMMLGMNLYVEARA